MSQRCCLAEILADQRATRRYLMDRCLETRRFLGLEVPVTEKMPIEEDTLFSPGSKNRAGLVPPGSSNRG